MRKSAGFAWVAMVALAASAACSDDETASTGDDPGSGAGGDGAAADGGGGAAGQCLPFGTACVVEVDTCCDTAGVPGECYAFGMGQKCTIPCPGDPNDCPNNSIGCNGMTPAYCKTN